MKRFNKELKDAGELVAPKGWPRPEQAQVVRASKGGAPEVTDGPFAEAKEFLAGYWIVDCREPGAGLRDRRPRVGGAGPRRRAAEHADRGARGDERTARRRVTAGVTRLHRREPAARAGAAGSRRRGPALRRLLRRRGRRAGGAARGGHAVAGRGCARQPARLADPGRRPAHDRSPAQPSSPGGGARRSSSMQDAGRAICRRARRADSDAARSEQDDTLILLFMCCHPALTRPSAIALTLRAVGGLTTAEIANAFLVPEATMAQRISRAKQTHQDVRRAVPHADRRGASRAAERRAARALSDLQRGLHQQRRARLCSAAICRTRRSG